MNKKRLVVTLWAGLTALLSLAQKAQNNALENYFVNYKAAGQLIRSKSHLDSLIVDDSLNECYFCDKKGPQAKNCQRRKDLLECGAMGSGIACPYQN